MPHTPTSFDDPPPVDAVAITEVSTTFTTRGAPPVPALREIDVRIAPGEVVAVLGPNGAGKTTLFDTILGFTEPTSGQVRVFGRSPRHAIEQGRIAAVLQHAGLLADLGVEDTVRSIAALYPHPRPVSEVMARAGLEKIRTRKVGACSGGQQQRIRFALALLPDPDLLILDEPTAAMDVATRRDFWASMHDEAHSGSTIVLATHHGDEAQSFADRIILLDSGRVVADGPVDHIRSMAGTSRITATWRPGPGEPAPAELPAVVDVERATGRIVVESCDSDATARALFTRTSASDITINPRTLDDAIVALTTATETDRARS